MTIKIKFKNYFYLIVVLMTLVMIMSQGCSYENEEELFGIVTCDVSDVSYQADIAPLMDLHCNTCHSTSEASGGIILDTYSDVNESANGNLLCSINHADDCANMPRNQPKLSDCTILIIKTWIDNGALNN